MPNDGTGANWDESYPQDADPRKDGAKEVRDVRKGVRARMKKEHADLATATAGGEHLSGSAKAYSGHTTPTLRPDGVTALGTGDKGRIWNDETTGNTYNWNGTTWVQTNAGAGTKVAVIQELATSGTAGGTFTAGSYVQRTLTNVVADPSSIVSSLSSNRFTLAAGTYFISARAPAYQVSKHQARLVKDPAGSPAYFYSQTSYEAGGVENDYAQVDTVVVLAGSTVFEIQHRCTTTKTVQGFGAAAGFGNTEVYTSVTIIKLA